MKRILAISLALCLAMPAAAFAEEQTREPDFVDTVGSWFDRAVSDVSDWASQAWKDTAEWADHALEDASAWASRAWTDASAWIDGAWGDASKWVEQAWNGSSEWVTEIWGDVSAWAVRTFDSASGTVSAWWEETFNTVTEKADDPWSWITEEAKGNKAFAQNAEKVKQAVTAEGADAEARVKETFDALMAELGHTAEDSQKVWDTVRAYAAEKGIDPLTAAKLALPYLLKLTVDGGTASGGIPAVAVAQYLTAIAEKQGTVTGDSADALLKQLTEALGTV